MIKSEENGNLTKILREILRENCNKVHDRALENGKKFFFTDIIGQKIYNFDWIELMKNAAEEGYHGVYLYMSPNQYNNIHHDWIIKKIMPEFEKNFELILKNEGCNIEIFWSTPEEREKFSIFSKSYLPIFKQDFRKFIDVYNTVGIDEFQYVSDLKDQ